MIGNQIQKDKLEVVLLNQVNQKQLTGTQLIHQTMTALRGRVKQVGGF